MYVEPARFPIRRSRHFAETPDGDKHDSFELLDQFAVVVNSDST